MLCSVSASKISVRMPPSVGAAAPGRLAKPAVAESLAATTLPSRRACRTACRSIGTIWINLFPHQQH